MKDGLKETKSGLLYLKSFFLHVFILWKREEACHSLGAEVIEQLGGVSSLLTPCGYQGSLRLGLTASTLTH